MKSFVALLLLLISPYLINAEVPLKYTTCGVDHLQIESITASEFPIKAGESTSLKVTFTPDQTITSGIISLIVEKFNRKLTEQDYDLCSDVSLACPVAVNEKAIAAIAQDIPSAVPAIKATAHIVVKDGSGIQLSCVEAPVQVVNMEDGRTVLVAPSSTANDDVDQPPLDASIMSLQEKGEAEEEGQIERITTDKVEKLMDQDAEESHYLDFLNQAMLRGSTRGFSASS